jgi:hypothetical protein
MTGVQGPTYRLSQALDLRLPRRTEFQGLEYRPPGPEDAGAVQSPAAASRALTAKEVCASEWATAT